MKRTLKKIARMDKRIMAEVAAEVATPTRRMNFEQRKKIRKVAKRMMAFVARPRKENPHDEDELRRRFALRTVAARRKKELDGGNESARRRIAKRGDWCVNYRKPLLDYYTKMRTRSKKAAARHVQEVTNWDGKKQFSIRQLERVLSASLPKTK